MDEMTPVQLGGYADCQVELAHRGLGPRRIGNGTDEIAAHADEDPGRALLHRAQGFDDVMTMLARGLEAEDLGQPVQIGGGRLFVDADGAVALHVRVATDRRNAGAGLAEIPLEQQQVRDLLQKLGAFLVLGQAHAIGDHGRLRIRIDPRAIADLRLAQSGCGHDLGPVLSHDVGAQGIYPIGMFGDEGVIQNPAFRVVSLDERPHHPFQQGQVATDLDMNELAGDVSMTQQRHLTDILRIGKLDKRAFRHRVDNDDRHAALSRLDQVRHHPGRVCAGILPEDEDRLGGVEILHDDRALADADRGRQAPACRFVAHIGAVGEIVGAELTDENREQESCLVGGSARGIELSLIRIAKGTQMLADHGKCLVP